MVRIPILSSKEVVKIFGRIGYFVVRQRGSHIRLHHKVMDPITVPNHKIIGRGLLKKLLRDSKLSLDEFIKLMI